MSLYLPTVITRQQPEKGMIRPGVPRPEFVDLPRHHYGTQGRSTIEQDVVAAYVGNDPTGGYWHNSADREADPYKLHAYGSGGQDLSEAMVWSTTLKRYVLDCDKLTADVHHVANISNHPLHFATTFSASMWVYLRNSSTLSARFFHMSRTTLPAMILGTDYQWAYRIRYFIAANTGVFLDTYSSVNYPVNQWFVLTVAYVAGGGMSMAYDGVNVPLVVRAGSVPANIGGTGSDSFVLTRSTVPGMLGDMILRKQNVGGVGLGQLVGGEDNTSINGFVRGVGPGVSEPPAATAATPGDRAVTSRARTNDDAIALDADNHITRGLTVYLPVTGFQHLADLSGNQNHPIAPSALSTAPRKCSWLNYGHGMHVFANNEYWKWTSDIWPTGDITLSFWIFNDNTVTSQAFGHASSPATSERCLCHCAWSDGNIYWDYGGFTAGTSRLTASPGASYFLKYNWHHVVLTARTGLGQEIWLDGKKVTSHSGVVPTRSASSIVSAVFGGQYRLEGGMAEFAVWARYLKDSEKVELYRNPLTLRKYTVDGAKPSRSVFAFPASPVSNAKTIALRATDITRPQSEMQTAPVDQPFEVNTDYPLAKHLRCWFQYNGSRGRRMTDISRRTPTMQYHPTYWNAGAKEILDPDHGRYWDFDGADDRATAADFTANEVSWRSGGFAIETAILPRTSSATQYIVAHGQVSSAITPGLNYALRQEGTEFRMIVRNSANTAWVYSTTNTGALTVDAWNHVIFWIRNASWGFYVNGEAKSKTDVGSLNTAAQSSNVPLKFATRYDQNLGSHGSYFTGGIAYVRIYHVLVNAQQAKELSDGFFYGPDPLRKPIVTGPQGLLLPDRHWVGEDADWFTPRNWSRAAGGARGAGVPDCINPVFFDADRAEFPE